MLQEVQGLLRDLRNLEYLLKSEQFALACERAIEPDKRLIDQLIRGSMIDDPKMRTRAMVALKLLIKRYTIEGMSSQDLKDLASQMQIKGWSRMTKDELIGAIQKWKV